MIDAKYVHTNLIANDWRALSDFYQQLFGCVPVPPERDFRGEPLPWRTHEKRFSNGAVEPSART